MPICFSRVAAARHAIHAGEGRNGIRSVRPGISPVRVHPPHGAAQRRRVAVCPAKAAGGVGVPPVVVRDGLTRGRGDPGVAVRREVLDAAPERPRPARRRAARARVEQRLAAAFERGRCGRRSALPRRHLHDAADGVAAEQRALRPAHGLDLRDVAERQQREVEAAAERVHLQAVDEDERVVGLAAAREDGGQRAATARARDGESRQSTEGVGDRFELPRLESRGDRSPSRSTAPRTADAAPATPARRRRR